MDERDPMHVQYLFEGMDLSMCVRPGQDDHFHLIIGLVENTTTRNPDELTIAHIILTPADLEGILHKVSGIVAQYQAHTHTNQANTTSLADLLAQVRKDSLYSHQSEQINLDPSIEEFLKKLPG